MHSPEGSYCFAQPGQEGQGWSRTAGAEPPQRPPGQPSPLWPWGRAGGAGPAWGMWGCSKSHNQPRVGAQPRERGVRAELLHSRCPGPCGRGGSARSPPRGDIRGPSTMPALGRGQATGDCTWRGRESPGAQREGHSSTRAQMLVRQWLGAKLLLPAAPGAKPGVQGPPLPEAAQVQREGRVAAREDIEDGAGASVSVNEALGLRGCRAGLGGGGDATGMEIVKATRGGGAGGRR